MIKNWRKKQEIPNHGSGKQEAERLVLNKMNTDAIKALNARIAAGEFYPSSKPPPGLWIVFAFIFLLGAIVIGCIVKSIMA